MAAYRYYDPAPANFNLLATGHLATGSLTFYDIGTTNPRDTWNDPALDVPHLNANPLNLDASGRASVDIFLDGDYTVKLTDGPNGTGATIWTRDVIPGGDAGLTIPALVDGQFLTNDGINLLWSIIRQVPDPTGQTGKVLTSTGAASTWSALPAAPTLDVVITANSIRIGDGVSSTKILIQWGTDTAPSTGAKGTSKAVTWPTAYLALYHVAITTTIAAATPSGALVDNSVTSWVQGSPSTGANVNFNVSDDDSSPSWMISNPITFSWFTIGTVTV